MKNATMATNTTVEHVSECIVEQSVNVPVPQISGPKVEEVELFSWVQPRTVERIVDVPVVMRVQEPVIQKAQETVQDPQVPYIDRIGDSPVVMRVQEPVLQEVQKTVRGSRAAYVDRIGDPLAVLRRREAAVVNQRMSDQQDDCATSSMTSAIQVGKDSTQALTTPKRETSGMMDGDQTDGNDEWEGKGNWSQLYGPEYCSECGQNPFECGCLNVDVESKEEKRRREKRERVREMFGNPEDCLRNLQEEMAEISFRVEKLERAMSSEGSGSSGSSGGSEWAWWNNAWWIKAGSRVNSAGKRRVSRAVRQAMGGQGDKARNDMAKWMAYLQEIKFGNLSDNDRKSADRQIVMQTEDTWNIDCDETARRAKGGNPTHSRKATSGASTAVGKTRVRPGTLVGLDMFCLCTPGLHPGRFH